LLPDVLPQFARPKLSTACKCAKKSNDLPESWPGQAAGYCTGTIMAVAWRILGQSSSSDCTKKETEHEKDCD